MLNMEKFAQLHGNQALQQLFQTSRVKRLKNIGRKNMLNEAIILNI
jgi:hypothetical protein